MPPTAFDQVAPSENGANWNEVIGKRAYEAKMAEVVLDNLSRVFQREVVALDSVNLRVKQGELLVLLGPSGSGKTTLLRLIAGLDSATSGEIELSGRRATALAPHTRDASMVLQQPVLYPHLTVRENLAFGLKLKMKRGLWGRWLTQGESKGAKADAVEIDRQVSWAAELMQIEHLLDRMPGELAGGEQQRVVLGRALARRPQIFLLDEPLTSLDTPLRNQLRDEIKVIQQKLNTAMIYVTHDQSEAFAIADRIAVMQAGRIEQLGPPEEIYDKPATRSVARFIGIPPENFLVGRWEFESERRAFRMPGVRIGVPATDRKPTTDNLATQDSQTVICAFHPEHMVIGSEGGNLEGDHTDCCGEATIGRVSRRGDHQLLHLQIIDEPKASDQQHKQDEPKPEGNNDASEVRQIVCKTSCGDSYAAGSRVRWKIDPRHCHWFHPTTGERLEG